MLSLKHCGPGTLSPGLHRHPLLMMINYLVMQRLLFLVVIFFFFCLPCRAQDFQVYTTKGDITVASGHAQEIVVPGMSLSEKSILTIPDGARIVLLSEKDKKLYTIKEAAQAQLGSLIVRESSTTQQLTDSYLTFIRQKISDSGEPKEKNYRQSAGTSFRDADSTLIDVLVREGNKSADTTIIKKKK